MTETFSGTEHHRRLQMLAGHWEGPAKTWFEPGELGDESLWTGVIRPILAGRYVVHEYRGQLGGEPFEGMMILGYHKGRERFEAAWVDSFHTETGIMFSEGEVGKRAMSVLGSYGDHLEGGAWGWRTTIDIVDEDHIVITAYNITPGGEQSKAVETKYTRRAE